MPSRYKHWCIVFNDTCERNVSMPDGNDKLDIEVHLSRIFQSINESPSNKNGTVDTDNFFLLRKGENYEYTLYFTVQNTLTEGYCKEMFN